MPKNMLVHDLGLAGRSPTGMAQNTYDVAAGTTTEHVMSWIATYARSQGCLDNLFIMCHGYEGGVHDGNVGISTWSLGNGLALGEPGLSFNNVRLCAPLRGHVSSITLFACGPAHTRPGFQNTSMDGMRFCGEMALISGAEVIAAFETQYYYDTPTWWDSLMGRPGEIDFGAWEGPLFRFRPDTGEGSRVL